jgi:hypothetical protein
MHPFLRGLGIVSVYLACMVAAGFGGCYVGGNLGPRSAPGTPGDVALGRALTNAMVGAIIGTVLGVVVARWLTRGPKGPGRD